MGQGGCFSQNKSIILSNWIQIKQNSNVFYNKVTNQQIQRHQVLINDKNQLSSYISRMQDQSALICRLIYFHPKSLPKQEPAKKHHAKLSSNQLAINTPSVRAKSMVTDQINCMYDQKSSPKSSIAPNELQGTTKIYCVYTDRMMPVKEWNKDKIIDVIEGFKKLVRQYGMFKVRQHCICENERKQIKIWINQNPVTNFPLQTVESEEDMIADLAALLVSKKQKIAKQLLDLQTFDQVVNHFSKLHQYDHKKFTHSNPQTNQPLPKSSHHQNVQKQSEATSFHHPPEVNNFYNVFINTDNSYTVSSSLQNSKYNIINKGGFGYPYYSSKNNPPPPSKQSDHDEKVKKETHHKTQTDVQLKRQHSPSSYIQSGHTSVHNVPNLYLISKTEETTSPIQKNTPSSQSQNTNQLSQNSINSQTVHQTSSCIKQIKKPQHISGPGSDIVYAKDALEERDLMENTSIMLHAKNAKPVISTTPTIKKSSMQNTETELQQKPTKAQRPLQYLQSSQKTSPTQTVCPMTPSLYQTQVPKSHLVPKFIPSSHQQLKNRSKNNSSGDININHVSTNNIKNQQKTEQLLTKKDFIPSKKEHNLNLNNEGRKNQEGFQQNIEKSFIMQNNYLTPQTTSNHQKNSPQIFRGNDLQARFGQFHQGKYASGGQIRNEPTCENPFYKNQCTPTARSQSKVLIKTAFHTQTEPLETNRNVVSQMSTLKPSSFVTGQGNQNSLNKKSFPKYFQEKQTAKSIQKHYEKSVDQRQKSRAMIGKFDGKVSPHKFPVSAFGGEGFQYTQSKIVRDVAQEVVAEVQQSEACSQEIIPPNSLNHNEDNHMKFPGEAFEQRRKFPSTTEVKGKMSKEIRSFEDRQFKRSKPGTQIDVSENHTMQEGPKSHIVEPSEPSYDRNSQKSANNTSVYRNQQKNIMITQSYFSQFNTNNSLLIQPTNDKQGNSKKIFETDVKKRKHFESMERDEDMKWRGREGERNGYSEKADSCVNQSQLHKTEEKESIQDEGKSRDSVVESDPMRNQSFPCPQPVRKLEKHYTFSQKPSPQNIEEIKLYEQRQRVYLKKESIKSNDEQSLPRTTADEREKRMFKATRTSQVLQTTDLHSSDPGQGIEKIVGKIEKEKQKMKDEMIAALQEKLDVKQYPKFKKWEPALNVYGSIINQQNYSAVKKDKKEQAKSQKQADDKEGQKQEVQKGEQTLVVSQNLQNKSKIRKEVFMDYKGLFGDENPFQKEETAEEKEKARRLQVKKRREEEERMLENTSSKDLLIQEKVQKQKQKHAQLKSDLSKLFTD